MIEFKRKHVTAVAILIATAVLLSGCDLRTGNTVNTSSMLTEPEQSGQKAHEMEEVSVENYYKYLLILTAAICQDTTENNIVFSPSNLYVALAMLTEITDGDSQREILDALGENTVEKLREQAGAIWRNNNIDDGKVKSTFASSIWLDNKSAYNFKKDTVKNLAEYYYASVYEGATGSEDYNRIFRKWLNDNTGGLLEEHTSGEQLSAETVLALAAASYFSGRWKNPFNAESTEKGIFHGRSGDETVRFMKQSEVCAYYEGDRFTVVEQRILGGGALWYILPDEGRDPAEVLTDEGLLNFLKTPEAYLHSKVRVNKYIPIFEAVLQEDLTEGILQNIGIKSVLSYEDSDFSPITDARGLCLSEVSHAARISIDEEGIEAAAYTVASIAKDGYLIKDTAEFVLNRPFAFVLTDSTGLPTYIGIIKDIK